MGKLVGPEDMMKAACWVVIEGESVTITDLNDSLYHMMVVSMGTKSMFVATVYNQKLSDSSHVCRGLYMIDGVGHERVLAVGVVRDTSTWLECRLFLQMRT